MSSIKRIFTFQLVLAATVAALAPASGRADDSVTTRQALADGAAWLAYAPAPAAGAAAVCFVDSGATLTPDTRDAIVARTAVDPLQSPDDTLGSVGDGDLVAHGTLVVSAAFAPANGWGTRGIWPAGKAVTVNSLVVGEHAFRDSRYTAGIRVCLARSAEINIKAIVLALGGAGPAGGQELEYLSNAVGAARAAGITVVAAGGNKPGPIEAPANLAPILAVTAADPGSTTSLCSFSASGPEAAVAAAGCDTDEADPLTGVPTIGSGTSQASARVGAVIAALHSYAPNLTVEAGEMLLKSTADGGRLNVAAAFRAAGLGTVVDAGEAALATAEPPLIAQPPVKTPSGPSTGEKPPAPTPVGTRRISPRWPRPLASVGRSGRARRALVVSLRSRPKAARVEVTVERLAEAGWAPLLRRAAAASRIKLNIRPAWQQNRSKLRLRIRYLGSSQRRASVATRLRIA